MKNLFLTLLIAFLLFGSIGLFATMQQTGHEGMHGAPDCFVHCLAAAAPTTNTVGVVPLLFIFFVSAILTGGIFLMTPPFGAAVLKIIPAFHPFYLFRTVILKE